MQPDYEIRHHPVNLSAHGLAPNGKPLYRVVWSDSRKTKLVYKGKLHLIPRYFPDAELNTGAHWILERWKSPEEFIGMSREQYEAMLRQFPFAPAEAYPVDGEYDFEYGFPAEVDELKLSKAIAIREYRRNNMTPGEKKAELIAQDELAEKREDQLFDERYETAREEALTECPN